MSFPLTGLLLAAAAMQGGTSTRPVAFPPLSPPEHVRAVRISTPIVLDGILNDPAWHDRPAITAFVQREPNEGKPATERTEVYLSFDADAVYVGARLYDSAPDSIIARLARRDVGTNADRFVVFLDPYHDGRSGVFFGVNAAGTRYDGTLYNDDWDDDSWDGVWEAKVHRDDQGWTVEMRIPFSQLRFRNAEQQTWGVNFRRDIARRNEADYIVYTPRNGSGFVSRFVPLVGIDGVRPRARLEILPYVTSKAELLQHAAGDPFNDGSRMNATAGVDIRYGLSSNLTLNATINPDFGQVEVDPAVVNLSDAETFYPEKRPFFVEGSNIFDFGFGGANNNWGFNFGTPDFFYSRRVGRPPQGSTPGADYTSMPTNSSILGAAKLTGKMFGNWNVGMMHALTGREDARLDVNGTRSKVEVEPRTYYGVYRGQKEIDEGRQGIGFISTVVARDFGDPRLRDELASSSLGFGLDGWTFLDRDKTWVITGWAGASRVAGDPARITSLQESYLHYFQRPDQDHVSLDTMATSLSGAGARVALNKQKGDWRVNTAVGFITPGFDINDAGFQWQSDVVNGHFVVSRRWATPGRLFRFVNINNAVFQSRSFGGDVTWTGLFHSGYFQLHNYYGIDYFLAYNPETISTRRTRGGPLTVNPAGVEGSVNVESDDRQNLVFGGGFHFNSYGKRSERSWSVETSVEWKPSSSMSLRFSPGYERSFTSAQYVGTWDDPAATATFGRRYVFADLQQTTLSGSLRLNWIFNPRMSLELYAQPLIASGNYYHYKQLDRPRSYEFTTFGQNGSTFDDNTYTADPDGPGGPAAPIEIGNQSFTFTSLRGNAVLRWEYMPGSTLFLVWTQNRSDVEDVGTFRFNRSLGRLFDARADNVFAVKVTYWWNP